VYLVAANDRSMKRSPYLSIQDGEKRIGRLRIVFMEIRAVIGFLAGEVGILGPQMNTDKLFVSTIEQRYQIGQVPDCIAHFEIEAGHAAAQIFVAHRRSSRHGQAERRGHD